MTESVPGRPDDPIGSAVAAAVGDIISNASVEISYTRDRPPDGNDDVAAGVAHAVGEGPSGWHMGLTVRLDDRVTRLVEGSDANPLAELLRALPAAGIEAAAQLRPVRPAHDGPVSADLERAVRDSVVAQILSRFVESRVGRPPRPDLLSATIGYLLELSSTRVEAHALTHGVLISEFLDDAPRLEFTYPRDLRAAKRAPLLFDGQRSVLVVDPEGRARTEVELHRIDRFKRDVERPARQAHHSLEGGLLVAEATRSLGGVGLYLRADRSLWAFADGEPVLVRRGEHWSAFPIHLATSIATIVGGERVASLVAHAAFIISAQTHGAILAVVSDPAVLGDVVPAKDRYDERSLVALDRMPPETRLHHLIDAEDLDERTLARLASLDGATVLDGDGNLIAYGAIVTSHDSQHEGARTAAARTLSGVADIVLKISVDGDITIFVDGTVLTTLLGGSAGH